MRRGEMGEAVFEEVSETDAVLPGDVIHIGSRAAPRF
jgi:hypothetical protein